MAGNCIQKWRFFIVWVIEARLRGKKSAKKCSEWSTTYANFILSEHIGKGLHHT
jgi:hypothetical protein